MALPTIHASLPPANLDMGPCNLREPDQYPRVPGNPWSLYARLPVQALFIAWVRAAAPDR